MTTGAKMACRGAAAALAMLATAAAAQVVPTDPQATCPIAPSTFAAMFQSGSVTPNGVVKPADSTVNLTPNCPFFVWSEQMFLWMTSPAPASYGGGGGRIMFSPAFYTVSPATQGGPDNGRRTFLPNTAGRLIRMGLRTTELGPHRLPALLSRSGHVVEVARPDPTRPVPPVVRLPNGASVRLTDVRPGPQGLRFFAAGGREVQVRKLVLPRVLHPVVKVANGRFAPVVTTAQMQGAIQARKFIVKGFPIFIDGAGNVIDVEPGQADSGVLLSQNGSLIYYITVVNDVFAYHRTMQGAAVIPDGTTLKFPMTASDATAVTTFAAAHGHTIVDPNALVIESKSSWIEADKVANPADYIQVEATVPTYDKTNPSVWVPNGHAPIKLVMVGIHVVGSTNGQGEMVWATFEHLGNTPNAQYSYTSTTGTKTVAQNTGGSWLFTPSGSSGPFNNQATEPSWDETTGNLNGTPAGSPIVSTATLRTKPWGTDGGNTALNTQVISANAAVISQLAAGDVRAQYFQVGTTWTIFGAPPSPTNQVGTNELDNSTIETFMQASTPAGSGSNCFSCHFTNTVKVSHSYDVLKPLF